MHNKKKLSLAIAALFAQGVHGTAMAQQESAEGQEATIERIQVKTRKIAETIETIPLAISAVTSQQIEEKGIQDTADVAKLINGLTFDIGAGPNDTRPTIRGLTIDRGRPNVAVLIDGIDVSSETMTLSGGGMTANMKLLDMQQVEVVKGPQSVNYGRSAFAGAINYVTKRPGFDTQTKVDVHLAQDNTRDLAVALEGGLTDKLAAKIKLIDSNSDGQYSNPNSGDRLGGSESQGAALSAFYLPTDEISVYFRAEHSDEHYGQRPTFSIRSMLPENTPGNIFGTGSVNTAQGAVMLPYAWDANGQGVDCASAYDYPYWNSFNSIITRMGYAVQPDCRAMVRGTITGDASLIDLSLNPLTGEDYTGTDIKNSRASLEYIWSSDGIEFSSVTGYTKSKSDIQEDFDKTNYSLYAAPNLGPGSWSQYGFQADVNTAFELEQYSQEFRLSGETGSVNWVTSALLWQEDMKTAFGTQFWLREGAHEPTVISTLARSPFTSFIKDIKNAPLPDGQNVVTPLTRDTNHWSVAALVNWAITDDLNLGFEGRYLDETIDYTGNSDNRTYDAFMMDNSVMFDPVTQTMVPNPAYHTSNSIGNTAFLPRASIDYQVNETVFTYASVSKGFKPSGVATTDANGDVSDGVYKPEKLIAYEVGAKAYSLENNASVNLSAFYWKYSDQQTPFTLTNAMGLAVVSVINAGESQVKGIEMESVWQVSHNFRLSMAYLYSDAKYTDFNLTTILANADLAGAKVSDVDKMIAGNAEADFSGQPLPLSSKHSGTITGRYSFDVGGAASFVELFGQYRSERNVERAQHSQLPAYWEWDLSAGTQYQSWLVTAYVENLFDDDKIKSAVGNVDFGFFPNGQSVPYAVVATLPQRRTAGIRISYKF
ncbi:TonB-dependent receptor [Rheinheimera sp. 1928-s]|uniref:TonB-dependent receptor n=1 Tax=Rheinheimera sp. 1928-s TaxID=3033803 RepID=UPI002612CCAF|nr:TonB-dependent receptor [Rheinheimera sp. 1928-s]MDF3125341.1 TonB-dependent receptor [Rheinheimera sp. 1928-s]